MNKIIFGDLIFLALSGQFNVIAHGCNCFVTMGAGIAAQIKDVFPEAYAADQLTNKGDLRKLGTLSMGESKTSSGNKLLIVNLYTQYMWGKTTELETQDDRYAAIRQSLKLLNKIVTPDDNIGLPKIGAGLAGGNWGVISKIIYEELPQAIIVEYNK
ncbi:MAG: macro domain-containing protein [Bacteroidota bacterium]